MTISCLEESDLLGLRQDQGFFTLMTIFGLFAEWTHVGGFAAFKVRSFSQAQFLDRRPQLPQAVRQGIADFAYLPFGNVPREYSEDAADRLFGIDRPAVA